MKGNVEFAFRVFGIDSVNAFGSFVVTLPRLWTDGIASEGDAVGFDNLIAPIEKHGALRLEHDDAIGMNSSVTER